MDPEAAFGAPTTRSGTPSSSQSPIALMEDPNRMALVHSARPEVERLLSTSCQEAALSPMSTTATAPPLPSNRSAPKATSRTPSPSTSPMPLTEMPNRADPVATKPQPLVQASKGTASRHWPSPSRRTKKAAPVFVVGVAWPRAPTSRSGYPSPSTSPAAATLNPKSLLSVRTPSPGQFEEEMTTRCVKPTSGCWVYTYTCPSLEPPPAAA